MAAATIVVGRRGAARHAQVLDAATGELVEAPRLWTWLLHVDPMVRQLSAALVVLGLGLGVLAPFVGVPLVLAGPALVRASRTEAIARFHERRAIDALLAELDQRHAEGELSDEALGRRRAWVVATVRA